MKFPKPRLRQVFEHSTHFKVVSPGGKSITIAKKAISPTLAGRLRKFAQGGEVQRYADGAEIPPVVEPGVVERPAEGSAVVEAPEPVAPVRTPVRANEATGVAMTVEEQAAQKLAELRAQEEADKRKAAQPAPAAPAPVVVNVNTAPAPAAAPTPVAAKAEAPVQKPAEKPVEAAPAPARRATPVPIVEERLKPAPVEEAKAPPVTIAPQESVEPAALPTSVPMGRFLSQPGLIGRDYAASLVSPVSAPPVAPAKEAMGPPEPVAPPTPAAPVAAPVAAPIVSPAPATVGPLPPSRLLPSVAAAPQFKRVTVEQIRKQIEEGKKSEPNATQERLIQSAVSSLVPGLTLPPPELQVIADLSKQQPKEVLDEALRDLINTKQAEAQVAYQGAVEQAEFADRQYKEALAKATRQQIAAEELDKRAADLRAKAEAGDDLKSFWGGQGFWRSVLGIASLAISGYTAGYAGTENIAYKAFENAVARDIDEQKRKRTMRWKQYEDILGDKEDAAKLYGADLKEIAAADLERIAKTSAARMIGPHYNELIAKIRESAAKDRLALAMKEELLGVKETEAEAKKTAAERPRAAPRVAGPKPPTPSQELAREVFETGRTVNVGTIPVQRSSSTGSKDIDINLANRNFAVKSLKEGVRLLEKMDAGDFSDFTGDKRAQAIAKLAYTVENFPQAFGYTRAVSRNAAIQLKEGLRNPTELSNILKQLIARTDNEGRKASTGLRVLRDEAIESRQAFVRQLPVAGSVRDKEAAEYGLYLLEKGENEPLGLRAPPKPKLTIPVEELERTPYQRRSSTAAISVAPTPAVAPAAAPVEPAPKKSLLRVVKQNP